MSDKEQQFEEIEQFIYDYVDSKQTEKVYLCSSRVNELAKPFVHNKGVANALYNAGYRKVPDGAVILMPKEREEELKACNEKQAVKEFAERLKIEATVENRLCVKEYDIGYNDGYSEAYYNFHKTIDELLSEYEQ